MSSPAPLGNLLPALRFASDAAIMASAGAALWVVALAAVVLDRRRHHRDRVRNPDRVGWMPWTGMFLTAAVAGTGLMAYALPALFRGG